MAERIAEPRSFDEHFIGKQGLVIAAEEEAISRGENQAALLIDANLDFIKLWAGERTLKEDGRERIEVVLEAEALRVLTKTTRSFLGVESPARIEGTVVFEYTPKLGTRGIKVEHEKKRACFTWINGKGAFSTAWFEEEVGGEWVVVSENGLSLEEAFQISSLAKAKLI